MAICLLVNQASAQTSYSWGNTGTDWNTAADWTPNTGFPGSSGPPPATTSDVASFDSAAVTNPNLSGSVSIASVNFSTTGSSGYTLSATNAATLTLNSVVTTGSTVALNSAITSGANTVSAPLIFGGAAAATQTVQQALGGTLNLTGNLSNTNALTFLQIGNSNLGTVSLTGTSTGLTAPVKLNGGTLVLGNDTSLGSGSFTFGTTSTIQSADTNMRTISNALASFGGSNPVYTFGTSSTGDLLFNNTTSASIGGAIARNFAVANTNTTIAGALTASSGGGLKKTGNGNLILLGANTYAGASTVFGLGTTIAAGTLTIGNGTVAGAALPGVSSLTTSAGTTLAFNNTAADASTTTGSASTAGGITKNGAGSSTINSPTFNATTTSGSTTISVTATGGLLVGSTVTGAGIPASTTITAIGTPAGGITPVTLNNAATATTASMTTAALNFGSSYTGNISVNGGTLSLGGVGAVISGSSAITLANGTTLGYSNPDQTFLNRINNSGTASSSVTAVVGLGTSFAGAATLNFANLPNVSLGATSAATLSTGTITPANNLYRLGGGGNVLTVNGALITGANNNLEVNGSIVIGSNPLAYGGSTTINSGGKLRPAADNRIPASTAMTVNSGGTFDLGNTDAGTTATVGSLAGAGLVTNSSSNATAPNKVLAVNPAVGVSTTFSGIIQDRSTGAVAGATLALTKSGAGMLALTGVNTYTGATGVTGGALSAGSDGALQSTGSIAVNSGGTLLLANATTNNDRVNNVAPIALGTTGATPSSGTIQKGAGVSEGTSGSIGLGALTLTTGGAGGIVDFTSTAGTLTFASFTPNGATLTINNYVNNGSEHLVFDQDQDVSMASSLGNFAFTGYSGVDQLSLGNGFYEIVPDMTAVPEPATWFAGLGIVAMLGMSQRKRLMTIV